MKMRGMKARSALVLTVCAFLLHAQVAVAESSTVSPQAKIILEVVQSSPNYSHYLEAKVSANSNDATIALEPFIELQTAINKLLTYCDIEIVQFEEAKREVDDRHDKAMKWNSIAGLSIGALSSIIPASFSYPGNTVSVRVPNDIAIVGGGIGAVSAGIGLLKQMERISTPESEMLTALIDQEKTNLNIYPKIIQDFFQKCTLSDLGYIGRRIIAIHCRKASDKGKCASELKDLLALDYLRHYWKGQFKDTFKYFEDHPTMKLTDVKKLSSDDLADRITMLTHLRILLESMQWANQEIISSKGKLASESSSSAPKE